MKWSRSSRSGRSNTSWKDIVIALSSAMGAYISQPPRHYQSLCRTGLDLAARIARWMRCGTKLSIIDPSIGFWTILAPPRNCTSNSMPVMLSACSNSIHAAASNSASSNAVGT